MTRRRAGRAALVAVLLAAGGLLVTSALRDTLTYYRTPAEVLAGPSTGERIRLGGDVVPGSLRHDGDVVVFRLAEGGREITVQQRGVPPETFREGEGAVVEGTLATDGVFHSDHVVVRHGNEYRPSTAPPGPVDAR
ncbi:cytochrome c maturation protein CcmE [Micromonospora sp. SL4-19]|uniref:cytochrome c maturation protein CcmE n=1 Tax=Micromonospora sp. SL4-19 TaxID=3399129 RepID=UPI003A4E44C0